MTCCCFTLTFAVEVLIKNDELNRTNNDEWVSLGPCSEGMRIQYNLYPGYTYDLDVLIWAHGGKIWCGNKYCWVRTWQMENKSWIAFTIRHKIPVKIEEFLDYQIFVVPINGTAAFSANVKNDKRFLIRIPPLRFRELQYFARIEDNQEDVVDDVKSILDLIWNNVSNFIPASYFDGVFDTPQPITDIQHQDAILNYVTEKSLSFRAVISRMENSATQVSSIKDKGKKSLMEAESTVYKLKITGKTILAGFGRINRFVELGQCQPNQGQVLAVLSSTNLPTSEDLPIFVINLNKLKKIPADEFRKAGFSQIYTRWGVGNKECNSEAKPLTSQTEILLDEHHVIPIERPMIREVCNVFMDNCFEIQLRGIREGKRVMHHPKLFKDDGSFKFVKKIDDSIEVDQLIACIKINTQQFFIQPNKMISGEFPFYPQQELFTNLKWDCTNHINAIRSSKRHKQFLSSCITLKTNMLLDISIGLLGCENNMSRDCFSRLYCFCIKENTPYNILKKITEINETDSISLLKENILSGFFLDMGDSVFVFVEGQKDKDIIKVWEVIEKFDPSVKSFYSSSDIFLGRIYPEMANSGTPFDFVKMRIPLSILLACPPVYVRPALPLPAKTALLKISHILMGKMYKAPSRYDMPTAAELRSFKLELCSPLCYRLDKEVAFNP